MVTDATTDSEPVTTDSEPVCIPGGRDVRASHDRARETGEAAACVVACPPHPQHGGTRHDGRLQAVSTALGERGVDCLRFDYGEWDGGRGELADTEAAVAWARDRYDRVGIFGYSFGGCLAIVAAASAEEGDLAAASTLAPARTVADGIDAAAAIDQVEIPLQIVYGTRDTTAEWEPVVERARAIENRPGSEQADVDATATSIDHATISLVDLPADHFFVGQTETIGETIGPWLAGQL